MITDTKVYLLKKFNKLKTTLKNNISIIQSKVFTDTKYLELLSVAIFLLKAAPTVDIYTAHRAAVGYLFTICKEVKMISLLQF